MMDLAALMQPLAEDVLEAYHPAIALAVKRGGRLRPNVRTLLGDFTTESVVGQPQSGSFTGSGSLGKTPTPISTYSIFGGCAPSIDPTRPPSTFTANPLAAVSDAAAQQVTGITMRLFIEGDSEGGTNYAPIPDDTPLQLAIPLLNCSRGTWAFNLPDGFNGQFTLQNTNNLTIPFKVWVGFVFFMLDTTGRQIMSLCPEPMAARRELCRLKKMAQCDADDFVRAQAKAQDPGSV